MANKDGTKSGGRKRGSTNRVKRDDVRAELQKLGVSPIESLVRLAAMAEKEGELAVAVKATSELCHYMYPKLQAVRVEGNQDRPISFNIRTGNGLPLSDSLKLIEGAAKEAALDQAKDGVERPVTPIQQRNTPHGHNGLASPPRHLLTPATEPEPVVDVKPSTPVIAPASDWDMSVENWNSRPDPSIV